MSYELGMMNARKRLQMGFSFIISHSSFIIERPEGA